MKNIMKNMMKAVFVGSMIVWAYALRDGHAKTFYVSYIIAILSGVCGGGDLLRNKIETETEAT